MNILTQLNDAKRNEIGVIGDACEYIQKEITDFSLSEN